jgi:uncharacterized Zn ribbon protein
MQKLLVKTFLLILLSAKLSFAKEEDSITIVKDSILKIDYFCLNGKKIKDISLINGEFVIEYITFKNKTFILRRRYIYEG